MKLTYWWNLHYGQFSFSTSEAIYAWFIVIVLVLIYRRKPAVIKGLLSRVRFNLS